MRAERQIIPLAMKSNRVFLARIPECLTARGYTTSAPQMIYEGRILLTSKSTF